MLNRAARSTFRNALLIGSTMAALLAGGGLAAAQDDPPGTLYQTEGNRESEGKTPLPSPYSRSGHNREVSPQREAAPTRAYASSRRHASPRKHKHQSDR
jgi:hypothetical protein